MKDSYSSSSVAKQLDHCSYCPKLCRHACPVSNADSREHHTPQSKMDRLNQLQKGTVPWSTEEAEPLWACTGCRQCTTYCDHGNEPGIVLFAGRKAAVEQGVGHPKLNDYPKRFQNRNQRLATSLKENVDVKNRATRGSVGFWPGCDMVDKSAADIQSLISMRPTLDASEFTVIESDQVCAGYPLLAAGHPDLFRTHAANVANELNPFETVVINCSACLHTLRAAYPAEGLTVPTKILSLAEYLATKVTNIPTPEQKSIVYYHDPCHLARYEGILEEPRRVLSRVAEIRDFHYSHTETECCGGGGLLPKTMPGTSDAMARNRLRDIAERGGGDVVTSCGTCTFLLKSNAPEGVDVYDLPGYLAKVIQESEEKTSI